jgi:transcription elongation factor GreA
LRARLKQLREHDRPAILTAVQRARELGDLSENADYTTARADQRGIDAEIRQLETILNNSEVIDTASLSGGRVMFGALVKIEDEDGGQKTYRILSEYESDASKNIISVGSPLARAMIGKSVGDSVLVRMPAAEKEFEILTVCYGD